MQATISECTLGVFSVFCAADRVALKMAERSCVRERTWMNQVSDCLSTLHTHRCLARGVNYEVNCAKVKVLPSRGAVKLNTLLFIT